VPLAGAGISVGVSGYCFSCGSGCYHILLFRFGARAIAVVLEGFGFGFGDRAIPDPTGSS
jgi:hypothetical protein